MTYMPNFLQSTKTDTAAFHRNSEAELLAERSRAGLTHLLTSRVPAAPESEYLTRLESELRIIESKKFCSYFLIVADYVSWAKEHGITVGPGRGSGPCSLVGFALGITAVDPIKYKLPFERFVNPFREVPPDFDLEFCEDRCHEVSGYIQSRYGADRVAQISSENNTPLAARLVIGDRPLSELVSMYPNPQSGFPAAEMTLSQIAGAGLVQFNVINQKAITLIRNKVRSLADAGVMVDIDNIALDDTSTYRFLSAGAVSSIPELDSEAYRSALMLVQPERFEELSACVALSYPRLNGSVAAYKKRKCDSESERYFHPALESITAETFGLILYQEQVMQIAHDVAGLSFAQGDLFRRSLNSSDHNFRSEQSKYFIDGAENSGLARTEAMSLFEHLAMAGSRSFNKSHAVSFALVAYQAAWLKVKYPD